MSLWQNKDRVDKMTIRLDYSRMMADSIGGEHGITDSEIDELVPRATEIAKDIKKRRETGELGFYELPYDLAIADRVTELAKSLRERFDDLVVLGIGGSALGGIALSRSLYHPLHNLIRKAKKNGTRRAFFLDNIDPLTCKTVLERVNLDKTIFTIITKSGTTAETISQFLIVRQALEKKLGKAAAKDHVVVITGEQPNSLRTLAEKAKYITLTIPQNVGGRFSVLSPVGLFPAAILGIDIFELLAGARCMAERCESDNLRQNPAYLTGALHYLADMKKGLNIAVMIPYCDTLYQVAFWFRQLWAESLGKTRDLSGITVNVGQTPIVALGATDQHSQLQLYMEGPFNKMVTFLLVGKHDDDLPIPPVKEKEYSYLSGHTLGELINIEAQATQLALTKAGRSNMSLTLPEVNPFTIGQLLFMLEVETVFTGGLYKVNPLDQPGVELSKHYIQGILGRQGFEKEAKEAADRLRQEKQYSI